MRTAEQIIQSIAMSGPGTAAEIAAELEKPAKTVGMACGRLVDRGLLSVARVIQQEVGRPARVFAVPCNAEGRN